MHPWGKKTQHHNKNSIGWIGNRIIYSNGPDHFYYVYPGTNKTFPPVSIAKVMQSQQREEDLDNEYVYLDGADEELRKDTAKRAKTHAADDKVFLNLLGNSRLEHEGRRVHNIPMRVQHSCICSICDDDDFPCETCKGGQILEAAMRGEFCVSTLYRLRHILYLIHEGWENNHVDLSTILTEAELKAGSRRRSYGERTGSHMNWFAGDVASFSKVDREAFNFTMCAAASEMVISRMKCLSRESPTCFIDVVTHGETARLFLRQLRAYGPSDRYDVFLGTCSGGDGCFDRMRKQRAAQINYSDWLHHTYREYCTDQYAERQTSHGGTLEFRSRSRHLREAACV